MSRGGGGFSTPPPFVRGSSGRLPKKIPSLTPLSELLPLTDYRHHCLFVHHRCFKVFLSTMVEGERQRAKHGPGIFLCHF